MWNQKQRIASLHLAETLRPTALPHDSALHLQITCKLLLSVRLGTSGDRRCGHQVGRRHSVLCFLPHDACTAVRAAGTTQTGKCIPCFGRIRFADPTLKRRLAEHPDRRSVFFFLHVAIRHSLRSNKYYRYIALLIEMFYLQISSYSGVLFIANSKCEYGWSAINSVVWAICIV